jgi:hypothetical protein
MRFVCEVTWIVVVLVDFGWGVLNGGESFKRKFTVKLLMEIHSETSEGNFQEFLMTLQCWILWKFKDSNPDPFFYVTTTSFFCPNPKTPQYSQHKLSN